MIAEEVKYPDVRVELVGLDGNVYTNASTIIGRCVKAARKAGVPEEEIGKFLLEVFSGDLDHLYDHLLQTCRRWWDVQ